MTDRPAPSAQGTFAKTPLAHVLLYIRERQLTGSLAIQAPESHPELSGESLLLFHQGALAQAKLPQVMDPLGFILREQGVITQAQLDESLIRLAAREGLQGEVLVAMGVEQSLVDAALRINVRRKMLRLFTLEDASYAFYELFDLMPYYGGARMAEEVFALVWQGVRTRVSHPMIEQILSRVGNQALRLRNGGVDLRLFEFDKAERVLMDLLRVEPMTLEQMLKCRIDPAVARALAYTLVVAKQVEIVPPGTRNVVASAPVPPPASPGPIPARASIPPPEPGKRPSRPSAPPIAPSSPGDPRQAGRPSRMLSPEVEARRHEADAKLASLGDQNFYEMLGLPSGAPVDHVRRAYMQAAVIWHPDKLPYSMHALEDTYTRIFATLTEAHTTLTDEKARALYDRNIKDGGGTPNEQRKIAALINAATDVQKAEIALKRKDFAEAEKLARSALEVNADDPSAQLVVAHAVLETLPSGPWDEAKQYLEAILAGNAKNDRAQVLMGLYYRKVGDEKRAMTAFKAAAEANPRNMDAARELRIAEMRKQVANVPSGSAKTGGASAKAGSQGNKSGAGDLLSRFLKR